MFKDYEKVFMRISILFSFVALALGGLFGFIQLVSRTPGFPRLVDASGYYTALTGHGVLMAIIWTAFFIMGIAVFVMVSELRVNFRKTLLGLTLVLTLGGTVTAAIPILAGRASVLYTFYPPLIGHPLFYIGLAVVIVGTWVFSAAVIDVFLRWRRANRGVGIPVGAFGVITTIIIWLEATPGLSIEVLMDLIPASLFGKPVDVLLDRTLFWYFGHPLVYFWLIPAIVAFYAIMPKLLGVELYSVKAAKLAYILFILASTPVGLHHQFVDSGLSFEAKLLHTTLTYSVALGSFVTAFNVLATLERAGRARGGGAFSWILKLPWRNPVFAGLALAFILFGFGGIGGIVNASLTMNYVVHNTLWVVGHFHLTVGSIVTLVFMSITYLIFPVVFDRNIFSGSLAKIQPYMWFVGMFIFALAYHIAGIYGAPRRVDDSSYMGLSPEIWSPLLQIGAVGGLIFWLSGVIFILNVFASLKFGAPATVNGASLSNGSGSEPGDEPTIFDRLSIWIIVALILIVIGYTVPMMEIFSRGLSPVEIVYIGG